VTGESTPVTEGSEVDGIATGSDEELEEDAACNCLNFSIFFLISSSFCRSSSANGFAPLLFLAYQKTR